MKINNFICNINLRLIPDFSSNIIHNNSNIIHIKYIYIYIYIYIQSVPKLFVQINTGYCEHQNKHISLWYIWSLTEMSDAGNDLQRR